jgi:hypothetical protein
MLANAQSGPTAANDFYTVTENTTLNVESPGLLANDITSNPPLEAFLVTGPSDGAVVIPAIDAISKGGFNGGFVYTPNFDFIGTGSCLLITDNYRPVARYGRRPPPRSADGTLGRGGRRLVLATAVDMGAFPGSVS